MPAPHSWMAWRKVLSCKRESTVAVHEPHPLSCTTTQTNKKQRKSRNSRSAAGAVAMSYGKAAHDDGYVEEDNDEKDGEYEKSTQKKKKKKQKGRCSPASFSSASASSSTSSSSSSSSSCASNSLRNAPVSCTNGAPMQLRALIHMHDTMKISSHVHMHGQFRAGGEGHGYGHSSVRCRSERVASHSSPSLAGHYDLLLQYPPSADALLNHSAPHSVGSMAYSAHSGMLCNRCGEELGSRAAFEDHTLTYHSVTELKEGDSARNIVEIIFQSSWSLSKGGPATASMSCKLERIFKVHHSSQTVAEFEKYRDMVKHSGGGGSNKISKRNSRCMVDGNELLRFYGTTVACSMGRRASWNPSSRPSSPRPLPSSLHSSTASFSASALCTVPSCGVCSVLRHGFPQLGGISTTSGSGRAHHSVLSRDASSSSCSSSSFSYDEPSKHAMLICRVIAGRVKSSNGDGNRLDFSSGGSYDSYSSGDPSEFNVDELIVFNNKAVLPCFIVIYDTC